MHHACASSATYPTICASIDCHPIGVDRTEALNNFCVVSAIDVHLHFLCTGPESLFKALPVRLLDSMALIIPVVYPFNSLTGLAVTLDTGIC
jgi:hypothetical protein